ncbi:MAG: multicopper oxidase family protein [Gammaproteobacteria bacterium]|nr:MAG: multicopper oxidase family protein [Gammaproteobacteria bacterium]
MFNTRGWIALGLLSTFALPAMAQSFRVQCPTSTVTHPLPANNNSDPAYVGPTYTGANGYGTTPAHVNGAIKCQQISGGDGYATMGDGTQTYLFSFGPLSGLGDIAKGLPGTEFPSVFNAPFPVSTSHYLVPGDPATSIGAATVPLTASQFSQLNGVYNGAVGLDYEVTNSVNVLNISETGTTVTVVGYTPLDLNLQVGRQVVIAGGTDLPAGYQGTFAVTAINVANPFFPSNYAFNYTAPASGLAAVNESSDVTASFPRALDGHVDPRQIMDVGVMNGNIPAPLMAINEDDEFFLTLTNVGMIMRPDLFEQHTVHFHGYPNASAFYDGVPDASVAINIGASFTYYYLSPDAGTYFWHCHITPPEHLQMGMVGQLYVRPRQDRVPAGGGLYAARQQQDLDLRTACVSANDILCSNPLPATANAVNRAATGRYAYNDGDGSTFYNVDYPIQIHGFDPNFHFVGMTFNPEGFADMKDKFFLLNGRSYPDTVSAGPLQTQTADGVNHFSQPLSAIINITAGQRALLRISDLDTSEYQTLASLGIPMQVIGYNAKLLRDQAGNNLYYTTNSITLAGGESLDVILDTCTVRATPADPSSACTTPMATGTYYLYTPNLDHLSNDAENFGGLMTEVHVN